MMIATIFMHLDTAMAADRRHKNWLTTVTDVGIIRATFWDIAHFQEPQRILHGRHV
jgi:hypothetical protein